MNDTPEHVARIYRNMLLQRPGAQRMRMGAAMFETAKRLALAGLAGADGCESAGDIRVKLFLRIYGRDFSPEEGERIAERLRLGLS